MTEQEIKDLPLYQKVRVKDILGTMCRISRQDDKTVFLYAKGKSRRGWLISFADACQRFTLVDTPEKENEDWHKRLTRAIKCMDKTGLWPDVKSVFKNLQCMTYAEKKKVNSLYWKYRDKFGYNETDTAHEQNFTSYYKEFMNKYPFLFKRDKNGILYVDTDYIFELSECKLKSMYFGHANPKYKKEIEDALRDKKNVNLYHIPVQYDVTFEYKAEKNMAWYSEEYRGCGNGHYYLALDHNTAVFCEND